LLTVRCNIEGLKNEEFLRERERRERERRNGRRVGCVYIER
jgi:hypothetical protein